MTQTSGRRFFRFCNEKLTISGYADQSVGTDGELQDDKPRAARST